MWNLGAASLLCCVGVVGDANHSNLWTRYFLSSLLKALAVKGFRDMGPFLQCLPGAFRNTP